MPKRLETRAYFASTVRTAQSMIHRTEPTFRLGPVDMRRDDLMPGFTGEKAMHTGLIIGVRGIAAKARKAVPQ